MNLLDGCEYSMNLLASISPLLFVVILSAWFRRPAFIVAWCGVALVAVAVLVLPFLSARVGPHLQGLGAAVLITMQVALVIGPGLYLNGLLGRARAHDALVAWVERIAMDPLHKRLMIVIGLAPALESLTGFGVSLLVTVPLLLAASERRAALRQSLLSMNIMPWGTLGLATVVGAQLSGQTMPALGFVTSLVSFGVFPMLGMVVGGLSAQKAERYRALRDGFIMGCVISLGLVLLNRLGITELAGILAGLFSALVCLLLFGTVRPGCVDADASQPGDAQAPHGLIPKPDEPSSSSFGINRAMVPPWHVVRPYAIVLGLIAVIRALPFFGVPTKDWAIAAGGVHFAPLTSPGPAMLVAILILGHRQDAVSLLQDTLRRALRPLLALGGFTVMAQMMVASGMIRIIGAALPVAHPVVLGALSAVLGSLSGYLTGSNVGGNALMMTMQASLTQDPARRLIFSAIQNSTAGHAVLASMPIILLVLAIAGPGEKDEEHALVRFGLKALVLTLALQSFTSVLLMAVDIYAMRLV